MWRIFLALPEPVSVAFAVGAFAGLRTAEVLGLEWRDIETAGRIRVQRQVQEGEEAILEDDESRIVPIQSTLGPILKRSHPLLGHSSTVVTERYAHLRPDLFGARVRELLKVDLVPRQVVTRQSETPAEAAGQGA